MNPRSRKWDGQPVVVCSRCRTTAGGTFFGTRPARFQGRFFGLTGLLCLECRDAIRQEEQDKSFEQRQTERDGRAAMIRAGVTSQLVILTPAFHLNDLNHAAAAHFIRTKMRPPDWTLAVANCPSTVP